MRKSRSPSVHGRSLAFLALFLPASAAWSPAVAQDRASSFEGRLGFGVPAGSFADAAAAGVSVGAAGLLHAGRRWTLRADGDFTALAKTIDRTGAVPVGQPGRRVWQYMGGLGFRFTPARSAVVADAYVGTGLAHFSQHGEGSDFLDLAGGLRLGTPISPHSDLVLRAVLHRIGSLDARPHVLNQLQLAVTYRS